VVQQFAQRMPEGDLNEAAALDVTGELHGQRAPRAAAPEVLVERRTLVEDDRHAGERDHVVDDRRLAEQTLDRRQRRPVPDHAALALEALQQGRLLAADVGAGGLADLEPDRPLAAHHALPYYAPRRGPVEA